MPTAPTTKKQLLLDAFLIVFGSFILAIGYSLFLAPAHISPGGVYGLALVIREVARSLFGLELGLGTIALVFNIPLFLLAMKGLGKITAVKTVVTFVLVALFSDLIETWSGGRPLVEESILCSFYGGALLGVSVWMIFTAQSTCAGTDTLARVLSRAFNTKVSTLIMLIDSLIVLLGLFVDRYLCLQQGRRRTPASESPQVGLHHLRQDAGASRGTHRTSRRAWHLPPRPRDVLGYAP